jgi:thiol-disulfide isomerase/thioredoxin
LPSFCTTERRSSASVRLGAALGLAALALGVADCERAPVDKPEPSGVHVVPPTPAATDAPMAQPVAPTPPSPTPATDAPADARTRSAAQVLEEVRRLGGKGTLVNAWASWCGPCKHELPMLARLAAKLAPQGVHVLLVSLDEPGDHAKADAFLKEHGIELPTVFAERPLGPFKQGMNPRWPGMLPASFLYDASGGLRYFWGGEAFEEELTPVLTALVAGKPIEGEANEPVAPEGERH